jgi:DNA-binding MarR family transcriptional regulator
VSTIGSSGTVQLMQDRPRWLDEREARAWRGYTRLRTQLEARLARELARHSGLSDPDYSVLVHLSEAPDGRLRAFELGRALQWEKSRLSHHLRRMEKRRLVARESCESDARGSFVVITPSGRAAIEAAAPAHVADVRRHLIDLLSPDQLDVLGDIAEAVLAHYDAEPDQAFADEAASPGGDPDA